METKRRRQSEAQREPNILTSSDIVTIIAETGLCLPTGKVLFKLPGKPAIKLNRAEYLRRQLTWDWGVYFLYAHTIDGVTKSALFKSFDTIEKAASRIVKVIGDGVSGSKGSTALQRSMAAYLSCFADSILQTSISKHESSRAGQPATGRDFLTQIITGVEALQTCAAHAKKAKAPKDSRKQSKKHGGARHGHIDKPTKDLTAALIRAYEVAFDQVAGTSTDPRKEGGAGGPCVKFIVAAMKTLGLGEITSGAARHRIRDATHNTVTD